MFTLGLDMFLRTGFLENYKNLFRTGSSVPYQIYGGIYGMLGVLSFMFLLGYLIQIPLYLKYKRKQRAKARASAIPSITGSNVPYDGYNQWGSQYGSRDQLTGPTTHRPSTRGGESARTRTLTSVAGIPRRAMTRSRVATAT